MIDSVLYELHFVRPPLWTLVISAAFLVLCLWGLQWSIKEARRKGEKLRKLIGIYALALWGIIAFWVTWIRPVTEYWGLRSAYQSGNTVVVEGTVCSYQCRYPGNGIYYEAFTVNDIVFSSDSWRYYPGYAVRGGVFQKAVSAIQGDGQSLRITYVPNWIHEGDKINAIVRIEELRE